MGIGKSGATDALAPYRIDQIGRLPEFLTSGFGKIRLVSHGNGLSLMVSATSTVAAKADAIPQHNPVAERPLATPVRGIGLIRDCLSGVKGGLRAPAPSSNPSHVGIIPHPLFECS